MGSRVRDTDSACAALCLDSFRVLEGASLSRILDALSFVEMHFPVIILSGLLAASFGEPKVDDNRI